jgi:hypothetical protein
MRPVEVSEEGGEVTPGVSTMAGLFGAPHVVDEVQELPMALQEQQEEDSPVWVIRTHTDIEDMTLGVPIVHMAFKAGVRYKVPKAVAYELARLDFLMEQPFPYNERMARR